MAKQSKSSSSSFGANMKGKMAGSGSSSVKYGVNLQKAGGGVRSARAGNPYKTRTAKAGEG